MQSVFFSSWPTAKPPEGRAWMSGKDSPSPTTAALRSAGLDPATSGSPSPVLTETTQKQQWNWVLRSSQEMG